MAAEISTAGIIPNMIHKTLFEDLPAHEALDWAEGEMQRVIKERATP
ncbi:MAG: hypothetical protein KKE73_06085 [Proteobacteria bacterium]|nr:hypothetical protein [Pseudomonadota bacterium]